MASEATSPRSPERAGNHPAIAIWAVAAAFGTYFCMYGLRKPFTAATFADASLAGASFKTMLVVSQVAGYMVSKFIGIRVISEMTAERRARAIVLLTGTAEIALILFAVTPRPWNAVWLFLNGLPLGMVFGLVLSFLEGRRLTEVLAAGLCASFILADGFTKSVGAWLLTQGISEQWMPAIAGGMFLAPLFLGVWMLSRLPIPDQQDLAARTKRVPLTRSERWALFARYQFGLSLIVTMYLLVTIVRSIRADFAPEIWLGLGAGAVPTTFTSSEIPIALGVLAINGGACLIRDNRRAFFTALATCGAGFLLIIAALLGLSAGRLTGFPFMVLVGLGLYLPYVAVHTTVFERFIAMTRDRGNIGFLMYLADAIGYLGYVAVMLGKDLLKNRSNFLEFFTISCWIVTTASLLFLVLAWRYFARVASAPVAAPLAEAVA